MNAPLPKSIQRTIEAAASAQAAIAQQNTTATAVVDDPAQLLAAAPAAPAASATPVASEPAAATPPTKPSSSTKDDDWEQKFRSMQGRYQAALAETQSSNATLKSQLAQMQQQIEALVTAAKATEKRDKPSADPKDVEAFGADMIEMVQRYAERVFQSMSDQFGESMRSITERVTRLEQVMNGVSARTETTLEQQFYSVLAAAVPDWEQVNANPRWLEWLGEIDPVYGVQRQAALDTARDKLDVNRTISIFRAFKAQHPARTPESLASQVAPITAAASPVPADVPAKPILSQKFVEKFYNDKAKGRIGGEEAARIEAEINLAAAEGRIR